MDQDGKLYDPYGGQTDLENKTLRHVSEAFAEDPLRVLRVARFAARYSSYGFQIAPEQCSLCKPWPNQVSLMLNTRTCMERDFSRTFRRSCGCLFSDIT